MPECHQSRKLSWWNCYKNWGKLPEQRSQLVELLQELGEVTRTEGSAGKTVTRTGVIFMCSGALAYKLVCLFKVNLKVFAVDPPISPFQFFPEFIINFRSMFCCFYCLQIEIF